jgi:hypothetical protein
MRGGLLAGPQPLRIAGSGPERAEPLRDIIAGIETSDTMNELRTSLHRIIQDYGFSGFGFVDAGRPELDVPYHTGTYPPAWQRTYLQNDFIHSDPALARTGHGVAKSTALGIVDL